MMRSLYLFFKYTIDRLVALLLLLLISPLFFGVCFSLLLSMGRPVFFRQDRGGLHNRIFRIYKFRTMTFDTDESGELLPDDARLTWVGRFVRKFSLDELPQLLNILKGEMSFIGPRPLFAHYIERYSDRQKHRHDLKPGITGWAQVKGRNAISWDEKFEKDLYYVENCSLFLDLKILFLTIFQVLGAKDINQAETITMVEFKGSSPTDRSQ